jgi:hypothetical protein
MSTFQVGTHYDNDPLPHVPEDTTSFAAGAITIAVEFRQIDDEMLAAAFGADKLEAEHRSFDDSGVSLHVFDAADNREYLRFDCFDEDPHYHYMMPGSHQLVVAYDRVACGDMLSWALRTLEDRIPNMLEHIGATDLASSVDPAAVRAALATAAPFAVEAQERHRALRASSVSP